MAEVRSVTPRNVAWCRQCGANVSMPYMVCNHPRRKRELLVRREREIMRRLARRK